LFSLKVNEDDESGKGTPAAAHGSAAARGSAAVQGRRG
jgi:hypothetical protein